MLNLDLHCMNKGALFYRSDPDVPFESLDCSSLNPLPSNKSSWVQSAILFQFTFCQIQQNVSYAWLVVYSKCAKNNSSLHTRLLPCKWGTMCFRQNQTIPADQQQQWNRLFSDLWAPVSLLHVSDFEERFCVMIARECKQVWRPRKCLHFFGRLPCLSLEIQSTQKAIIEAPCSTRASWSLLVFGCFSGCSSFTPPSSGSSLHLYCLVPGCKGL